MLKHFIKRGFVLEQLRKTFNEVKEINREDLLQENPINIKDQQSIFVCTWHPHLKKLSSILLKNFNIIKQDHQLKQIFQTPPSVAFRRKKNVANHLIKNDINPIKNKPCITSCNNCQICPLLNKENSITNEKANISIKLKATGNCKTKNIIYAAKCRKHNTVYTGHTGESLSVRFSKHKYDFKKRPDNSELAEHFHQNHDFKDLEIYILQTDIANVNERLYLEDKWMCRLQTQQPTGLNKEGGNYVKEMYTCWTSCMTSGSDVTALRR